MRCDGCGIESEIEQAFARTRPFPWLRRKAYCPTCQERRMRRSVVLWYGALPLFGLALRLAFPQQSLGYFLLDVFFILLLSLPMVVLHELAHALTARLMGMRVFAIFLGYGRPFLSRRLFGIRWNLAALPVGGATAIGGPPMQGYRLRLFLTYLSGPAIHAVALLLAMALGILSAMFGTLGGSIFWSMVAAVAGYLTISNLLLLIGSLIPRQAIGVTGLSGSDGWNLLSIPFLKDQELSARYAGYFAQEAVEAVAQGDESGARRWIDQALAQAPEQSATRNGLGYVLLELGEAEAARRVFSELVAGAADERPEARAMLMNNLAYTDAMLGHPELMDEAEAMSRAAYENAPWIPSIVGTRGAVMVSCGQLVEGIELLKQAMARQTDPRGRAADACWIAIAQARQGDREAARRSLAMARPLDPGSPILARARQAIEDAG
jgi:Zn-dependent protease